MEMTDANQLDPGSNATDFQPTTQNPQSLEGSNLQTPSSNVQPVNSSSSADSNQLYQQADQNGNLRVQTEQYSRGSRVSVSSPEASNNNGLITVTGALLVILIIVMIIGRYWREIPDVPEDSFETPVEPIAEANIIPVASTAKKSTAKKKSGKTKSKRR